MSDSDSTMKTGAGGYEILIHNVSHSDLILAINSAKCSCKRHSIIARPKFSHHKRISEFIYFAIRGRKEIVKMPSSRGMRSGEKYHLIENGAPSDSIDHEAQECMVPAGFEFRSDGSDTVMQTKVEDIASLRFRKNNGDILKQAMRDDAGSANGDIDATLLNCYIETVFFPLIAVLVPKWLSSVLENNNGEVNKVLLLITGAGTPADSMANFLDNSTEFTGKIIKEYINVLYPNIHVIHIHSSLNIFRYDDNIEFVKVYLNPVIDSFRDKAARFYGSDWKNHFHTTLSFADGSSARTSAISAAIRLYK